jgi:hypothetical protein
VSSKEKGVRSKKTKPPLVAKWLDSNGQGQTELFEDTEAGNAAAFERLEQPDAAKWEGVFRRGSLALTKPLTYDQVSTIAWGFQSGQSRSYLSEVAGILFIQSDSFDKLWASMLKDRRERRKLEQALEESRKATIR